MYRRRHSSDRPDSVVPGTGDAGRLEGSWCWMGPGPSVETGSPQVLVSRRLCEVLLKHPRGRNYSARKTGGLHSGGCLSVAPGMMRGSFPGGRSGRRHSAYKKHEWGAVGPTGEPVSLDLAKMRSRACEFKYRAARKCFFEEEHECMWKVSRQHVWFSNLNPL